MSDPHRLLDGEASELERALLRAARDDGPAPEARALLAATLGIAVGSASATAAATTTAAAIKAASAGSAASGSGAFGSAVLLKWLAVGVASGVLAVGGAAVVERASSAPPPETAIPAGPRALATATEAPRAAVASIAVSGAAAPDLAPLEIADSPPPPAIASAPVTRETARAPASTQVAEPALSPLAEETALLDRARASLTARDGSAALAALAEHDRRFASGSLAPEALVVRVEALLLSGRRADAERVGERFLASHPTSPLGRRIRSLLGTPAQPPAGGALEPRSTP